jgi:hypothetical protein
MKDFYYLWNSLYLPRNVSLSETTMEEPRLSSKSELLNVPVIKKYNLKLIQISQADKQAMTKNML